MPPSTRAPVALVVFGVTGDLFAKKIAPALSALWEKKELPERFRVFGVARRQKSALNFRLPFPFSYIRGDFENPTSYDTLLAALNTNDAEWGMCSDKLFYLSTPPAISEIILKNIAASKLAQTCADDTRSTHLLIEKPFGRDRESARALDRLLKKTFAEKQIYRIDHYLFKRALQNVWNFRLSHELFGAAWSAETIARIEARLLEKEGVEGRGAFYDSVGALRDVGQNHLLQMLALATMERPARDTPEGLRAARARVLARLAPALPFARAQYRGYRTLPDVSPRSDTETYFNISATLRTPLWRGVPIVLEGGKKQPETKKEIAIYFKNGESVVFQLEPDSAIFINKTRLLLETKTQSRDAYEALIADALAGDRTHFVGNAEVRVAWNFADATRREWRKTPLVIG